MLRHKTSVLYANETRLNALQRVFRVLSTYPLTYRAFAAPARFWCVAFAQQKRELKCNGACIMLSAMLLTHVNKWSKNNNPLV